MWLVVYQDPILGHNIANIDVTGFEKGSLVVHWKLIFAAKKNENVSEIAQEIDEKLKETFSHKIELKSAPLNVENAQLLSMPYDINPCANKDLNYCSKDADCIRDEYRGFRCRCKVGFLENSKHLSYPGETCDAICPSDYCNGNGYCEMRRNGERHCLCDGSSYGDRCNISRILVFFCLAVASGVLGFTGLAIVLFCQTRRQPRTRFYARHRPTRELIRDSPIPAASIPLDELEPTKSPKYNATNIPLHVKPDIQITSPSIIGSSISYANDLTFNRTPNPNMNMEPSKNDSVPVDIEPPKYDSVPVHIKPPKYDSVAVDMEPPKYDSVPVDIKPPKYDSVSKV